MKLVLYMHRGIDAVERKVGALRGVDVHRVDDEAAFVREVADADAAVISATRYTAGAAAAVRDARRLVWIQSAAAGYDPFVRHGVPAGIVVTNAAGVWGPTVAEHAMGLLLALVRCLPRAERNRARRDYDREATSDLVGSLEGRTALVVGFGSIGRGVATRARAFGMRTVGVNRDGRPAEGAERTVPLSALREALPEADAVVLSLPLAPETDGLIGREAFAAMRDSALLVNVGRGAVVDQPALVEALRTGAIAGAGLDVFETEPLPPDDPLWEMFNVVLTPHVGAYSQASFARLAALVAENVCRLAAGAPLENPVDSAEFAR